MLLNGTCNHANLKETITKSWLDYDGKIQLWEEEGVINGYNVVPIYTRMSLWKTNHSYNK